MSNGCCGCDYMSSEGACYVINRIRDLKAKGLSELDIFKETFEFCLEDKNIDGVVYRSIKENCGAFYAITDMFRK